MPHTQMCFVLEGRVRAPRYLGRRSSTDTKDTAWERVKERERERVRVREREREKKKESKIDREAMKRKRGSGE